MNSSHCIPVLLLSVILEAGFFQRVAEGGDEKGEWIQLFNGKNLDGWTPKIRNEDFGEDARRTFRAEKGVIVVGYGNYEEFKESFPLQRSFRRPTARFRLTSPHPPSR